MSDKITFSEEEIDILCQAALKLLVEKVSATPEEKLSIRGSWPYEKLNEARNIRDAQRLECALTILSIPYDKTSVEPMWDKNPHNFRDDRPVAAVTVDPRAKEIAAAGYVDAAEYVSFKAHAAFNQIHYSMR